MQRIRIRGVGVVLLYVRAKKHWHTTTAISLLSGQLILHYFFMILRRFQTQGAGRRHEARFDNNQYPSGWPHVVLQYSSSSHFNLFIVHRKRTALDNLCNVFMRRHFLWNEFQRNLPFIQINEGAGRSTSMTSHCIRFYMNIHRSA